MHNETDRQGHDVNQAEPDASGSIVDLTEEERAMLREFAEKLRDHDVRNPVAREALDRAAEQLDRVAGSPTERT